MSTINSESKVVLHYRITLEDGTVADSTWEDNEPIAFAMGDGTLSPGLETSLLGLKTGDHETIVVEPDHAFGYKDTANIHRLPRSDFDSTMPLEEGMVIGFALEDGGELPGMIINVDDDEVLVDFNHPFSGHQLDFEVEIISVEN
jgi:FKBP-type peptidyl-prolyl cis-trans isomerase SlpA